VIRVDLEAKSIQELILRHNAYYVQPAHSRMMTEYASHVLLELSPLTAVLQNVCLVLADTKIIVVQRAQHAPWDSFLMKQREVDVKTVL
jgi:hypothetical protein